MDVGASRRPYTRYLGGIRLRYDEETVRISDYLTLSTLSTGYRTIFETSLAASSSGNLIKLLRDV
jgi:hypothetical protein